MVTLGINTLTVLLLGTELHDQLPAVFQSVRLPVVPPTHWLKPDVKAALLALTVEVHAKLAVKDIAVTFTTLAAPAVGSAAVVNVPVPGLPAVKLIVAVVELTVLVPLTL